MFIRFIGRPALAALCTVHAAMRVRRPADVALATGPGSAQGIAGGRPSLVAHLRAFPGCDLERRRVPSRDADL